MADLKDLTGQRFGMLVVVSRAESEGHRAHWNCVCDCGTSVVKNGKYLLCGDTESCGCKSLKLSSKNIIKTGDVFGDWTVLSAGIERLSTGRTCTHAVCKCTCGAVRLIPGQNLKRHLSTGCGCRKGFKISQRLTVHGTNRGRKTPTVETYNGMIQRCYNPNFKHYHRYGGRGIKICDRWLGEGGFKRFLKDMGERPAGLTIERKDNDGNYSPGNCRKTRHVTINGVTRTISEWAEITGIKRDTISHRVMDGWEGDKIIMPVKLKEAA
jgi:hypothetical protein